MLNTFQPCPPQSHSTIVDTVTALRSIDRGKANLHGTFDPTHVKSSVVNA